MYRGRDELKKVCQPTTNLKNLKKLDLLSDFSYYFVWVNEQVSSAAEFAWLRWREAEWLLALLLVFRAADGQCSVEHLKFTDYITGDFIHSVGKNKFSGPHNY
jgi:hypothetical protein